MSDTVNLDEQLEKVNIALMEGDLASAVELLPEIIEKGDEDQQQIAEAYLMQLEMLSELESENEHEAFDDEAYDDDEDDEDIPDGLFAGDDEEEDAILGWGDDEEDEIVESQPNIESTEIEDAPLIDTEVESATTITPSENASFFDDNDPTESITTQSQITEKITDNALADSAMESEATQLLFPHSEIADLESEEITETVIVEDVAVAIVENVNSEEDDETTTQLKNYLFTDSSSIAEILTSHEENDNKLNEVEKSNFENIESEASQFNVENVDPAVSHSNVEDIDSAASHINVENNDEHEKITVTVVNESLDDIKSHDFVEDFSDDEAVDNLLAPSMALKSFTTQPDELLSNVGKSTRSYADISRNRRQGFLIGDTRLMIDFADGNELLEMPKYFGVPNSPNWVVGLTNMHGNVVPIFDLVDFLGLPKATHDKKPMLLVLEHDEKAVGVIVNGFPRRLTWDDSNEVNSNTAPSVLREHLKTVCLINDNLWFDLNVTSLCNLLEKSL